MKQFLNAAKEVFKAFGQQPILGDMRRKTKWSVFIKEDER